MQCSKIVHLSAADSEPDLRALGDQWRTEGKRIVHTNGCFDLLHVGHIRYLQEARTLGDVLVLGLNSDASVRQLKGPTRPVVTDAERAEILAALTCVDCVVIFDELVPDEVIRALRPDIHVKGGDYAADQLPETPLVQALGGSIAIVPLVEGKSTTQIIQRLSRWTRSESAREARSGLTKSPHPTARANHVAGRKDCQRVIGVIPARYHSTRLDGKALLDICGKPMIQRVYEQTRRASSVESVYVATDDERIFRAVESFGGRAIMTSSNHPSGTDRLAEAVADLACDIVVNVQGDEPMVDPSAIDKLVAPLLEDTNVSMSTLAAPINEEDEFSDPNVVKVVTDQDGYALYFSRACIPYHREGVADGVSALHHMGLYAYRKDFLLQYASLSPSPLENLEKLEQLRVLENGYRIKVVIDEYAAIGVDTEQDLERIRQLIAKEVN
ncbi:MAG: 3-deoxy-manno-octulosonate cytidylyltransferase [Armatimonadetes bacterium]|nr:3-deoxy-manno-octulosonate cytidylyltransferase [Armatimonadota bacterium]PIU63895.1 MAG: hypothetical protein COS85_14585 [Armatimonadetes bacterium CG07_land_8_20_14_0_80_59_28]PIX44131.1 MAG: hypothetical protein COZ56_05415 [Armatimonadetes bacterium CG_4_8_14_3_um_filter_58_9]PIY45942.1 MAG: hypothetical protein COZ05_06070 [Armatimonadetes bacterium CG_4_10_14_3_um_filter_59_10]PJB73026.1 MAG: hypothetical protein CO095_06290 [Armatimonadetes bacterium CG_4_9_14_3_um_filter_58_7]